VEITIHVSRAFLLGHASTRTIARGGRFHSTAAASPFGG
jgi:hypothetical protein